MLCFNLPLPDHLEEVPQEFLFLFLLLSLGCHCEDELHSVYLRKRNMTKDRFYSSILKKLESSLKCKVYAMFSSPLIDICLHWVDNFKGNFPSPLPANSASLGLFYAEFIYQKFISCGNQKYFLKSPFNVCSKEFSSSSRLFSNFDVVKVFKVEASRFSVSSVVFCSFSERIILQLLLSMSERQN